MNYYIQGCAANADKIKAAFEDKGYNTTGWKFNVEGVFYYTHEGRIDLACGNFLINLIKTHPDYKELELPVEPKFKVGDEIIWGSKPTEPVKIIQLIDKDQLYMVDMQNGVGYVAYGMQDYYKLVPRPHYDIKNFHAGMPVLVRDYIYEEWRYVQFSHMRKLTHALASHALAFNAGCQDWYQCIPFNDDTEHLLGTTDMPSEEFINW